MSERRLDAWGWVLLVLGIGSLANALWMLVDPGHWYDELPAGVPDYGPLNVHFVRDIGCAFGTVGVAQIWAAFDRRLRLPLVAIAALFLGAHAALHIHDTLRGIVASDHWWLDLPGVYLPALVLAIATCVCVRTQRQTS